MPWERTVSLIKCIELPFFPTDRFNFIIVNISFPPRDPDPGSALWLGIKYVVYAAIGVPADLIVLFLSVANESVRAVLLNVCIYSLAFAHMMILVSFISSTFHILGTH